MAGNLTFLTRNREGGFTIPELLVVVAVIMLMTGLILPNWKSGEQSLALDRVAHKAGQDVRRAQELSMRAEAFTCTTGSISGYGVFFDQNTPTSYILFAECNGNNMYNDGVDGIVGGEGITLESGIEIFSLSPSEEVSIVFEPPTPRVFVNGQEGVSAQVSFQRTDGVGAPRTLDISSKGVIDID